MLRLSGTLSPRILASVALLALGSGLASSSLEAQGPRAGLAPAETFPLINTSDRLAGEGKLVAKLSGGQRGLLIGMAIGTALGVGLGYLGCTAEQNEIPCSHLIPVIGAGGLVLGGLMGYSIGRETP